MGSTTVPTLTPATGDIASTLTIAGKPKNKKRGAFHLLRAALFILRGKGKKSKSLSTGSTLARLLFSGRPLHVQESARSPAPPLPPPSEAGEAHSELPNPEESNPGSRPLREVASSSSLTSLSPSSAAGGQSSSSTGGMSRYDSAQNLQALDNDHGNDEEEESDKYYDGIEGDEMIDSKAEEFIAQFYQQVRIQRLNAVHRRRV